MDYKLAGSSVSGISQARMLEQVAISFSRGSSQPRNQTRVSWLAGGFFTTEPPGKLQSARYSNVIKVSNNLIWSYYRKRDYPIRIWLNQVKSFNSGTFLGGLMKSAAVRSPQDNDLKEACRNYRWPLWPEVVDSHWKVTTDANKDNWQLRNRYSTPLVLGTGERPSEYIQYIFS